MDWRIAAGVVGIGAIYLLISLYRGRLVAFRTIERSKEPQQFWLYIVLFCVCLALIAYGSIGDQPKP